MTFNLNRNWIKSNQIVWDNILNNGWGISNRKKVKLILHLHANDYMVYRLYILNILLTAHNNCNNWIDHEIIRGRTGDLSQKCLKTASTPGKIQYRQALCQGKNRFKNYLRHDQATANGTTHQGQEEDRTPDIMDTFQAEKTEAASQQPLWSQSAASRQPICRQSAYFWPAIIENGRLVSQTWEDA